MSNAVPKNPNCTLIRVKPDTRKKLNAIAERKRWKLNAMIDALADEFMAREGIKLPPSNPRPMSRSA